MARIELRCDTPMYELRGFSRAVFDGKKNAYTTDKLTDDEFNFISGMNHVWSHCLSLILDNLDEVEELDDGIDMLHDLKKKIAETALTAAKNGVNAEISQLITEFIDSHDD